MNKDFMGIILDVGRRTTDKAFKELYEAVSNGEFVDCSLYALNESEDINESLDYQSLKLVKEKYGNGVALTWGDIEYRYISDEFTAEELYKKLEGIMKHQSQGQISKWLRNHAIVYWDSKKGNRGSDDELLSEDKCNESAYDGFYEGDAVSYKGQVYVVTDPNVEKGCITVMGLDGEAHISVSKLTPYDGKVPKKLEKYLSEGEDDEDDVVYVPTRTSLNEACGKKKKSGISEACGSKKKRKDEEDEEDYEEDICDTDDCDEEDGEFPVVGETYQLSDGEYTVELVQDDMVYVSDKDGEYYSMSIEDFLDEVED